MHYLRVELLALFLAIATLEANAKQVPKGREQSYQLFNKQLSARGSGHFNSEIASPSSSSSAPEQANPIADRFAQLEQADTSTSTSSPTSTWWPTSTSSPSSSAEQENPGSDRDSAIGGGALYPVSNPAGSRYYNVDEEDDDDNFVLHLHKNNNFVDSFEDGYVYGDDVNLRYKLNDVYYKYGRVRNARLSNRRRPQALRAAQRQRRRQRQRRQALRKAKRQRSQRYGQRRSQRNKRNQQGHRNNMKRRRGVHRGVKSRHG